MELQVYRNSLSDKEGKALPPSFSHMFSRYLHTFLTLNIDINPLKYRRLHGKRITKKGF